MKKFINATMLLAAMVTFEAQAQTIPPGTVIGKVEFAKSQANPTVAEASDFTTVADSSGSLGGTSFRAYSAGDAYCVQPWYDVDDGSTAPTASSGCTLVEVDIATDDTADTVAGNTRTALNTAPHSTHFAVTGATDHVILTSLTKGAATDGNIGDTGFSVSKTQGVSGAVAIAAANVVPALMGWRICNYAVNTSTWLAIGEALDPETDGLRIGKGKCYDCPSCSPQSLKDIRLSSQAASNDYSVTQFKQ